VSVVVRARGILNGRFAHSPLQTRQTHGNARIRENAAQMIFFFSRVPIFIFGESHPSRASAH